MEEKVDLAAIALFSPLLFGRDNEMSRLEDQGVLAVIVLFPPFCFVEVPLDCVNGGFVLVAVAFVFVDDSPVVVFAPCDFVDVPLVPVPVPPIHLGIALDIIDDSLVHLDVTRDILEAARVPADAARVLV